MEEHPLRIPLLLGGSYGELPAGPSRIVSWTGDGRTQLALAYPDNSIYLTSIPSSASSASSRDGAVRDPIPTIIASAPTPPVPSGPSSAAATAGNPSKRPIHTARSASYAGRSRAPSTASSILTTASSSRGNRRVAALSPPTSPAPATTSLTSAFALGKHENLSSDGLGSPELREHLREQSRFPADDERGSLGLGGFERLGRRGVSGVRGKEERVDGMTSPRSVLSDDSNRTLGSRLTGWFSAGTGEEEGKRDVREMIEEVEVEREMEREVREDEKEQEEREVVERARRTPLSTPGTERSPVLDSEGKQEEQRRVVRVLLRDPGRGRISDMRLLDSWGICVLRDIGILDIVSTSSYECVASINLEEPEDKSSPVAGSSKAPLRLSAFWQWRSIHLVSTTKGGQDASALVASGVPWPCHTPSTNGEVTRVVMIAPEGEQGEQGKYGIVSRLELPGEGSVGVTTPTSNESYLVHFTPTSLTSYNITYDPAPPRPPTPAAPPRSNTPLPRAVSTALANLPLRTSGTTTNESGLRGVKSMMALREDDESEVKTSLKKLLGGKAKAPKEEVKAESWVLGEGKEVGRDGYGDWKSVSMHANGQGVGWSDGAVDLFECDGKNLRVRGSIELDRKSPGDKIIEQVSFSEDWHCVAIISKGELTIYRAPLRTKKGKEQQAINLEQWRTFESASAATILPRSTVLLAAESSMRTIDVRRDTKSTTVIQQLDATRRTDLTSVLPLDIETCFSSDDRGNVSKRKLSEILSGRTPCPDNGDKPEADRLDSLVTCLRSFRWESAVYIVAGDADGVVRIWTATTFELQGSFTLFAWPVYSIALLDMPQAGTLRGCLLCTSEAGTIGIINLREMDQLFLMPAARTPLRRVFVGGEDVLLAYTNGKARVWNVESMEFRRSTGLDAAEDMLASGDWAEVDVEMPNASIDDVLSSALGIQPSSSEAGRIVLLDLRKLGKWLHDSRSSSDRSPLGVLRVLLSMLITTGVDEEIDRITQEKLGIHPPALTISSGIESSEGGLSLIQGDGYAAWHTTPSMTATRQLAIIALLRPFLDSPDDERWAAQLIAFYTASLPSSIVEPDLEFFARYYLDSSPDVHQAARMLFAARLDRMTETEIEEIVAKHQADLPNLRPGSAAQDEATAMALTMIGGMAVQKFQCINPIALKAVSESLSLYLHSPDPAHVALGIELTSKGFSTWQTYVDPSDLLRRLFYLSTHPGPSSGGSTNIAAQARLAVLHVANQHAALFMSTLSMDILDAKTVEGRTSIMKLCVYLARKKPQVLEHSLPKIAEAVVKSLDPNLGKMRDDVWQAATVILNELVLAFSTIDFHSGTQKLAIGTHEGSLIMFDLKTASRLYILQPHTRPVSAVTFSPDGRRLITVSLIEGNVTVWKVGSSISGFFNVGGPPRQGGDKGEPFKRIEFRRADDGPMDSTSALSDIKIEWPGARQARVTIKETLLTFET